MNSQSYVEMLQTFFTPALQQFEGYTQYTWFHNHSLPVVQALFLGKLISRRGDIQCPPPEAQI